MAAGTPVVGSHCGGIAEQIVDGESGLLFPPGDAEALGNALSRLINDRPLGKRLVEEGLRRVRTMFPLESTYRHMATLFDQVTGPEFNASPRRDLL
jgi:glycosyltransferase involved in cell wall biosynthesis